MTTYAKRLQKAQEFKAQLIQWLKAHKSYTETEIMEYVSEAEEHDDNGELCWTESGYGDFHGVAADMRLYFEYKLPFLKE